MLTASRHYARTSSPHFPCEERVAIESPELVLRVEGDDAWITLPIGGNVPRRPWPRTDFGTKTSPRIPSSKPTIRTRPHELANSRLGVLDERGGGLYRGIVNATVGVA